MIIYFTLVLIMVDKDNQAVLSSWREPFETLEACEAAGDALVANKILPWRGWVCYRQTKV